MPQRSSIGRALGHCCFVLVIPAYIIIGFYIGWALERSERER